MSNKTLIVLLLSVLITLVSLKSYALTSTFTPTATVTPSKTPTQTLTPSVTNTRTQTATSTQTFTPIPTVSIESAHRSVVNTLDGTLLINLNSGFTSSTYTIITFVEEGTYPRGFNRIIYTTFPGYFIMKAVDFSNNPVNCKFFPINVRWFAAQ